MTPGGPSLGEVLDEAGELVPAAFAPWVGLLWLTSAPLRLAQAHFLASLGELGDKAGAHGDHLRQLALGVTVAFVASLWGRAVYCRACTLRLRGSTDRGDRSALRVPPPALAAYVCVAAAIEVGFFATAPTLAPIPALILVSGLAAATSPLFDRPGLLRPLRTISANARRVGSLIGLIVVIGVGFVLASANLLVLVQAGLWLLDGAAGLELSRWQAVLGLTNARFLLVVAAGGWLLVEPFWLAALVSFVHRLRARGSGEDLWLRFERIRGDEE